MKYSLITYMSLFLILSCNQKEPFFLSPCVENSDYDGYGGFIAGGGSYNSDINQDNESGVNAGHGYVIIYCGN